MMKPYPFMLNHLMAPENSFSTIAHVVKAVLPLLKSLRNVLPLSHGVATGWLLAIAKPAPLHVVISEPLQLTR